MASKARIRRKAGTLSAVITVLACSGAVGGGFAGYFYYRSNYSDGWHTDKNGNRFYILDDGVRAVGYNTINNSDYIFSEEGYTLSGWQEYEGYTYYLDSSGVIQRGETEIDGELYYLSPETGIFRTGLVDLNGSQYFFDDHGYTFDGFSQEGDDSFYYDASGKTLTGWAQINGYRGDTSIRKRIDYDIYYIENWSMSFDIKIMLGTIRYGFINKNAY